MERKEFLEECENLTNILTEFHERTGLQFLVIYADVKNTVSAIRRSVEGEGGFDEDPLPCMGMDASVPTHVQKMFLSVMLHYLEKDSDMKGFSSN